jgi:putative ABC transport system permease protein
MIKNYIKTAFRNLLTNKAFTAINVLGLALGLATCLLIVFYVFDELGYDRYNEKADRIYRVNNEFKFGGAANVWAVAPAPLAQALKTDFPEIEQVARLSTPGGNKVKTGNQNIQEKKMVYADPTLFDIFSLSMINGDPKTALEEPHTVVITESTAMKYFTTLNAVGKVFVFNDTGLYKVTGVMKDVPKQSHFNFDFFISMSTMQASQEDAWFSGNFNTYILLRPGTDPQKLSAKLPAFTEKHVGPQLQSILHLSFPQMEQQDGNYYRFRLFPLLKIHLWSNALAELGTNGNIQTVYIFAAIAVLILLIACVNFMNLSTARSSNRAKEVGVRKVLGSARKYLIAQFLTESILVTLIGAVIAVLAAYVLLPLFNGLSGKQLTITPQLIGWLFPVMMVFTIIVGCLAGSYPALYLSSFQPIGVLKGKLATGFKGSLLRNVLVVGQFTISIGLIIGTLVVYNQLKYIQNKDLGYNREHVLIVRDTETLQDNKAKAFKHEVQQLSGVQNVTMSDYLPTSDISSTMALFKSPVLDQKQATVCQLWDVDEDYVPTLGIKMAAGRNFSEQMGTDSTAIIVNEAAAKQIGFNNPLNQIMFVPQDNMAKVMKPYHIIGVMKDFNFKSLRQNVMPLILFNTGEGVSAMAIRIKTPDVRGLVDQVRAKWTELSPNQQFDYNFMDDEFDKIYRAEQRIGQIGLSFTALAIIIACLGLFGLAAFAAEQRTKEIGIRKVLGANVSTIVGMLSKDFILLVLIAILVAVPAAWYFMNKWLEGFAFHRNIQWWILTAAGLGAIAIAFLTICVQSIKAASANPVKSLRSM